MRRFSCPACGNEVHFENTICIGCGSLLGYVPRSAQILAAPPDARKWQDGVEIHVGCANRSLIGCNWLVMPEAGSHCLSCRHTAIIPDLSAGENLGRWSKLENAKRTLFYSLLSFGLPLPESGDPSTPPLLFELKADTPARDGSQASVTTGHENGVITINIAEADDDIREKHRVAMAEPYRTLIGHFRHEVGHYYWDRLVAGKGGLSEFRLLFGDEREDYAKALKRYYQEGPSTDWPQRFVSAYATSHPWEDFAETWAHYFHMVDGLETAESYGIHEGRTTDGAILAEPYRETDIETLVEAWIPLTVAMNAMNRSIGNRDFYPFVLSETTMRKLEFIHALVHGGP